MNQLITGRTRTARQNAAVMGAIAGGATYGIPYLRSAYDGFQAGRRTAQRTFGRQSRSSSRRSSVSSDAPSSVGGAAPIRQGWRTQGRKPKRKTCKGIKGKVGKELCKLENQVKELKYSEKASLGTMRYRKIRSDAVVAAANQQNYGTRNGNDLSIMQDILSNLKYYDPSTPGTLLTADFETGTYDRNIRFKSITQSLELTNNYQSRCHVKVYLCRPKRDTSIAPVTAWSHGINDNAVTGISLTDLNQQPTDYGTFRDLWSAKVVLEVGLNPGQSARASHTENNIDYSPALADVHADTYQVKLKPFSWMIIVNGHLGHDTTLDEQGILPAGVDYLNKRTAVVQYDAGVNLEYLVLAEELAAFTNAGVESQQPVADNKGYEVA